MGEGENGHPIVKYGDTLQSSVQRRLNRYGCHLGCGLGWAVGIMCWMGSIGAKGRCHGNQFWDAICYNWLWRLMGYNFGCMIASDMQFDSRGRFSGSSYPMKT